MKDLFRKVSSIILAIVMIASVAPNINSIKAADGVLTSSEISVVGYQIKTNVTSSEGVAFRTVCKAPDIGSTITVDGAEYTVKSLGTIYTKDPNRNGKAENKVLNKTYTELDSSYILSQNIIDKYGFKYIGKKSYEDNIVTYGYIATEQGILSKTNGYTSYIRTMTNMDDWVLNTLWIRPFVEATDADGNETIIYGEYVSIVSVAEVAYKVYTEGSAKNAEGHKYLYDSILSKLPKTNPFYMDTEIEFGWSPVVPANK